MLSVARKESYILKDVNVPAKDTKNNESNALSTYISRSIIKQSHYISEENHEQKLAHA
jgi:hypothetical protein